MRFWLSISLVCILLFGLWQYTDAGRYAKTLVLIAQATPYEQAGSGEGAVLVLGDSTGYGTGAQQARESVAGRLGQDIPDYRIENNSSNGRQIREARDIAESLSSEYDLVLLQIGANDLLSGRPVDAVVADMRQLVALLQPRTTAIVIMTAGNIGSAPVFSVERSQQLSAASLAYTQAMSAYTSSTPNVWYVSLYDEPNNDPFLTDPQRYFAWDMLHPSGAGYGLWYLEARPVLYEALSLID